MPPQEQLPPWVLWLAVLLSILFLCFFLSFLLWLLKGVTS